MPKLSVFPLPVRQVAHPTIPSQAPQKIPRWEGQNIVWSYNFPQISEAQSTLTQQLSSRSDPFNPYIPQNVVGYQRMAEEKANGVKAAADQHLENISAGSNPSAGSNSSIPPSGKEPPQNMEKKGDDGPTVREKKKVIAHADDSARKMLELSDNTRASGKVGEDLATFIQIADQVKALWSALGGFDIMAFKAKTLLEAKTLLGIVESAPAEAVPLGLKTQLIEDIKALEVEVGNNSSPNNTLSQTPNGTKADTVPNQGIGEMPFNPASNSPNAGLPQEAASSQSASSQSGYIDLIGTQGSMGVLGSLAVGTGAQAYGNYAVNQAIQGAAADDEALSLLVKRAFDLGQSLFERDLEVRGYPEWQWSKMLAGDRENFVNRGLEYIRYLDEEDAKSLKKLNLSPSKVAKLKQVLNDVTAMASAAGMGLIYYVQMYGAPTLAALIPGVGTAVAVVGATIVYVAWVNIDKICTSLSEKGSKSSDFVWKAVGSVGQFAQASMQNLYSQPPVYSDQRGQVTAGLKQFGNDASEQIAFMQQQYRNSRPVEWTPPPEGLVYGTTETQPNPPAETPSQPEKSSDKNSEGFRELDKNWYVFDDLVIDFNHQYKTYPARIIKFVHDKVLEKVRGTSETIAVVTKKTSRSQGKDMVIYVYVIGEVDEFPIILPLTTKEYDALPVNKTWNP